MKNSPTYTALDLLDMVIEFTGMTPDSKDWDFKIQKNNTPRFVRLEQIMALMWAFVPEMLGKEEEGKSIENFYTGDFILHRHPLKDYASLQEEIQMTIEKSRFGRAEKREIDASDLQFNYRDLLNYYIKLKKLMGSNSGMIEISYPYYFSYIVTSSVSNSIASQAGTIARLLVMFIDPKGLSFTKEEMIERYYYPEDDLLDLDIDWM
jgi:hypothetical protein